MNTLFALNHWLRSPVALLARTMGLRRASEMLPAQATGRPLPPRRKATVHTNSQQTKIGPRSGLSDLSRTPLRRLTVVQLVEHDMPGGSSGRLLITGALDDVCAELDRLVEREEARTRIRRRLIQAN